MANFLAILSGGGVILVILALFLATGNLNGAFLWFHLTPYPKAA